MKCPHCNSTSFHSTEIRLRDKPTIVLLVCNTCSKQFPVNYVSLKNQHSAIIICVCILIGAITLLLELVL